MAKRPKLSPEQQLLDNEARYRQLEDPMIVHETAVVAKRARLPIPGWVVREWTKWSSKLVKARGHHPSLTGTEIGRALELLGTGPGRGTPMTRGQRNAADTAIARIVEQAQTSRGISLDTALRDLADLIGLSHKGLERRYHQGRDRLKNR